MDICAAGDQPLRCRDLARVGQLVLNRGLWPAGDGGAARRLVREEFVEQMFTVQNPHLEAGEVCKECKQYSLLSSVHEHSCRDMLCFLIVDKFVSF